MIHHLNELKSPTNAAYDWSIAVYTLGIWKDVRLEASGPARIEWTQVRTGLKNNDSTASVRVRLDVDSLEPLEGSLGDLPDVLRPAVEGGGAAGIGADVEAELGGDHHLPAEGSESFTHELLIDERAVNLGGVEERDAAFHGGPEKGDHLPGVLGRAVGKAHAHAAETHS
jgi:hypothetical protein